MQCKTTQQKDIKTQHNLLQAVIFKEKLAATGGPEFEPTFILRLCCY